MCTSVRTRILSRRGTHARAYATRLESVHLSEDARRTHVRRSRHYQFTTRRSRAGRDPDRIGPNWAAIGPAKLGWAGLDVGRLGRMLDWTAAGRLGDAHARLRGEGIQEFEPWARGQLS
ncbi:hypothetical protein CRG98_020061 [Punica granatum]|uniref:Uncharacterized protein n=1 Tax=Punica granatum TaxID=22663 RepID=A0A2I0JUI5_PUNGR|nr:hypothetical protein CRG98_020061 [Punica granatum]